MRIIVYDDNILEEEEYFTLSFPTLTTSKDVLLITETSPNSVRVVIQDDEGNHNIIGGYISIGHNSMHAGVTIS